MNINPGDFVTATAGKEIGKCFIVLSVENRYLYLCDGKNRRISNPRKKSIKHVSFAGSGDTAISELTDKGIRRALSELRRRLIAENSKTE